MGVIVWALLWMTTYDGLCHCEAVQDTSVSAPLAYLIDMKVLKGRALSTPMYTMPQNMVSRLRWHVTAVTACSSRTCLRRA